jgi:nitroreductase
MAALLVLQTAVDEGLGACFFGVPGEHVDQLRADFGIPMDYAPVGAITVGHRITDTGAQGSPTHRARRDDVVHRGRWGHERLELTEQWSTTSRPRTAET